MDFSVILQTPQFRAIVQENALDRMFRDALFPEQLFRAEATAPERWDANVGDNKTFTGKGLMAVNLIPLIPGQDPQPGDYSLEQWTALQAKWANSIDTNLPTAYAACVNKLTQDLQQLGLNAGQTLNRVSRYRLFNAADSGWTVADGAQSSTTTLLVKRLNGFTRSRRPDLSAGSPVRYDVVTANNPLSISYVHTATTSTVNVIGFTPVTPGDEIGPGTLTLDAAITVSDRDPVMASTRTFRTLSGGGNATDAIGSTDILHLVDVRTAVARLRDANVQPTNDGYFHFHLDPTGESQLFADNEVQRLNIGQLDSDMYKDFQIGRLMGCIFYRNNEVPKGTNVFGGTTATFSPRDPIAGELYSNGNATTGTAVHRALVVGREAFNEYYVDQTAMITEAGVQGRIERGATIRNNGIEMEVERIKVIMRSPQDRLQENVSNTWAFQGDFVVRTDGATGDAAAFKRVGAVLFGE
jgi:hypothetical protein